MGAHSRSLQERVSRGRGSEGGPRAHRIKRPALTLRWAPLVAQMGKSLPTMPEAWVPSLGREDPLEKGGSHTTEQLTHTHTHTHTQALSPRITSGEAGGLRQRRGMEGVVVQGHKAREAGLGLDDPREARSTVVWVS